MLEGEPGDPDSLPRRRVVIDGLPPTGRPTSRQVTMRLNENGILQVAATDVATGAQASTTIVREYRGRSAAGGAVDAWRPP